MYLRRTWLTLAALLIAGCNSKAPDSGLLRVGTSGDYHPFSFVDESGQRTGLDIVLVERFARETGRSVEFVPFVWRELSDDFSERRFDLAVGGITVRPERSVLGRFSAPILESGAVLLVAAASAQERLSDFDSGDARIGVNAGGHLERVARARFPRATLLPFAQNAGVPEALAAGDIDAAMTDSLEVTHWQELVAESFPLGPITRDVKAWWIQPDARELADAADDWLFDLEASGELAELRLRHTDLREPSRSASPLDALLAAIAERLALMVDVASFKRSNDLPVFVPAREAELLQAAERAASDAARETGAIPPDGEKLERFFRSLFRAAREIQTVEFAAAQSLESPRFDLGRELRPALGRIGQKLSRWLVKWSEAPSVSDLGSRVKDKLGDFPLSEDALDEITSALAELGHD